MAGHIGEGRFRLEIPLDASGIEDFKPDQPVKVAIVDSAGHVSAQLVKLDEHGRGGLVFAFDKQPGALRVVLGPEDATDDDLVGLQTINVNVSERQWAGHEVLRLTPIKISAYYWHWWRRWCRTFTIRGQVVCPDGSPVPGAKVCAYDVDMWWWWCSKQQIGCAVTDATGSFEIKFNWCCGWWPWWWWRSRIWHLEPMLAEIILPRLTDSLKLRKPPIPRPKPDLGLFDQLLAGLDINNLHPRGAVSASLSEALAHSMAKAMPHTHALAHDLRQPKAAFDPAVLDSLRERLVKHLPQVPEIEKLRLWPWWPWHPWWDCSPDIIFRVTQNCHDHEAVIVDEHCFNTRWNIPTNLNVTLVANDEACCVPPHHGCLDGNCLALTEACDDLVDSIGGNLGAVAAPAGYLNPGLVSIVGDRPYAGNIPISGTAECMGGVDYYEFEWSDDGGGSWNDMPATAIGGFTRTYIDFSGMIPTWHHIPFNPMSLAGRNVFETLAHYEANNPPPNWGADRVWVGNRDVLMVWVTDATHWNDGTYRLRVKGWNQAGTNLVNPRTLLMCGSQLENFIVLTIDNRLEGAGSGHPTSADHPCGGVHTCTTEPDTDIIAVRIIHADQSETSVEPCGTTPIKLSDMLQIDFMAHDPEGHLAYYTLDATYGENQIVHLLDLGGTLTSSPAAAPVPPAAQVGPYYGHPNATLSALDQGAVSPSWEGGAIRLLVPAHLAFPETCCYQLELRAHKRTIVSCNDSLWGHVNYSEYSFMVLV